MPHSLEEHYITHVQRPHSMPTAKNITSLFFFSTREGAIDENGNPQYFLTNDSHAIPHTCINDKVAEGTIFEIPKPLSGEFATKSKIYMEAKKSLWMDADCNVYWGESEGKKAWWQKRKDIRKTAPVFSLKDQLGQEL